MPYHIGYTCEQYETYLKSRHCRFCASPLTEQNIAADTSAQSPALKDVCNSEDCIKKRNIACEQVKECGHFCGGVRGEIDCLPCLQCAKDSQTKEDFCNICWVEDLGSSPSIKLTSCGHIYHYTCLQSKLKERWPSARITFGFMNCPLCKKRIEHPSLTEELKPILALRDDIEGKALQRLEFENLKNEQDIISPTGRYFKNPAGYAMDRFAYYPCFQCKRPYFGGQRRCDAGEQNQPFDPKDLICGACAGGALSTNCPKHGKDYIEFKCQFCCSIATWFCWGKTHFCEDCHTKQQKGDYLTKKAKSEFPVCPGPEKCPLKRKHPPNGDEFSLGCVLCVNENSF